MVYGENGVPMVNSNPILSEYRFIEIPYDVNQLKIENKALAIQWQDAVADGLAQSFAQNYVAIDCYSGAGRCWHILKKNPHW
jgi:predicted GNAT superfamily acetyltransferase